ncbi:hypothetical protein ACFVFS_37925 [Kitasatospora sp. NPDC057692]|uniref:hypothetical protein n=1 Tax=Kitasatospora sp. NPDC057692 TaxID=3346215 RepID=UPI0036BC5E00
MNVGGKRLGAALAIVLLGGASACSAAADKTSPLSAAVQSTPAPVAPASKVATAAQQLVGWPSDEKASSGVGRLAQQAIVAAGGQVGVKELCEAEWAKLTADQRVAVHRGGFFSGCLAPAPS